MHSSNLHHAILWDVIDNGSTLAATLIVAKVWVFAPTRQLITCNKCNIQCTDIYKHILAECTNPYICNKRVCFHQLVGGLMGAHFVNQLLTLNADNYTCVLLGSSTVTDITENRDMLLNFFRLCCAFVADAVRAL